MKDEKKREFTRRLSQCNSGEMIVIIYDILFAYMDDIKAAYAENEHGELKTSVRMALKTLDELIQSLDFYYDVSDNLFSLYVYCKNELSRILYENRLDGLTEADKILKKLYASFTEAAKQDTSGPLMQNTQQVYAGMTYARGELNENYMDYDNQRGFFV